MNRRLSILLLLLMALNVSAQHKVGDLFREMPDSLLPLLTRNNRLDLIDFCEAQMKSEVQNHLEGTSVMIQLNNDSLHLRLNDALSIKLYLEEALETYDSCQQVVCMVQTYRLASSDEEESVIDYYTVRWNRLAAPKLAATRRLPHSSILRQDDKLLRDN